MLNRMRRIIPYNGGAINVFYYFAPEKARETRIKAVAWGGAGGFSTPGFGGGGGGAGNYFDKILVLEPNSVIQIGSVSGLLTLNFKEYGGSSNRIVLAKGLDGSDATVSASGNGGDSGAGFSGGTNTAVVNHVGHGQIDFDGQAHTCGGWAGLNSALVGPVAGQHLDYSFSEAPGGSSIQQYKNRWPSVTLNNAGAGGSGGCSYFGGSTLVSSFSPGFGAGQRGQNSGEVGYTKINSPAFFEVEWEG